MQFHIFDTLIYRVSAKRNAVEILGCTLDTLLEHLGGQGGSALAIDEGGAVSTVVSRGAWRLEAPLEAPLACVHTTHREGGQASRILVIDRDAQDPLEAALVRLQCASALIIPLLEQNRCRGYILIGSDARNTFADETLELFDTIGRVVALAVVNARLYEDMHQQVRQSQALYEVGHALSSTLNLNSLLDLIVQSAKNTIPQVNDCVLHTYDEETGELHPRALSFLDGVRPDVSGRSGLRMGQGIAGRALETGEPVNVPDVSQDPRFLRVHEGRRFASMLVVPLKRGTKLLGTLSVDSQKTHAFSPTEERLLQILASQASVAIENARLVSDLQQSLMDLKSTQEQLIQSEKLSAMGQLIAGVAHELNNPLTAIIGYSQLLLDSGELEHSDHRDVDKINNQAQRAAKIVQNLLTFARQRRTLREQVDVNDLLERILEMRSYQLRVDNIEVVSEFDTRPLPVHVDPNQLQQIFLNLVNNAQDAMAEHSAGGRLTVISELCDGGVRVRFGDTGPGLAANVLRHLFEPFFTTKEVGKGTGLGLSICYGIVTQHGGRIWAENASGGGAIFTVELPLAEDGGLGDADVQSPIVTPTIGKKVLVVEDEEDVALLIKRILSGDGHQVHLAGDGEAALLILDGVRKGQRDFDLILTDIKMPGLSGPALYERLKKERPDMAQRVVFTTGDTMSTATRSFLKTLNRPYLSKPFSISDLRGVVSEILEE